ncbi:MAG: biotin/lipoyl-containing protein [Bacteroidota bacterium]|nr:biotin/lipoyl-containing protein [Bacteroidota bacterium]
MKKFEFTISGNKYEVDIKNFEDNIARIEVNGTPYKVEVHKKTVTTKTPTLVRKPMAKNGGGKIKKQVSGLYQVIAPLPGTIIKVLVNVGDKLEKGQKVLTMEAMKMENKINTDKEGVVKNIKVVSGDNVLQNDVLIEIEQ